MHNSNSARLYMQRPHSGQVSMGFKFIEGKNIVQTKDSNKNKNSFEPMTIRVKEFNGNRASLPSGPISAVDSCMQQLKISSTTRKSAGKLIIQMGNVSSKRQTSNKIAYGKAASNTIDSLPNRQNSHAHAMGSRN